MSTTGVIRQWRPDEGWGVVDSPVTPGGCWASFAELAADHFWEPEPGQRVELEWKVGDQDGFDFRVVLMWPHGSVPVQTLAEPPGPAYRSDLRISFDDHG